MRCLFIRHAQSVANAEGRLQGQMDFELSQTGREQAESLCQRFRTEELTPTHVYTSPLSRTTETATIASRDWDLPIAPWRELMEYGVGVFSGLTWTEIHQRFPEHARSFRENPVWDLVPEVETVRARSERGQRVVKTLLERHSNEDVVVLFTHGGILQYIFSALMGSSRTWGFAAGNTGVFDVSLDKGQWGTSSPDWLQNHHFRINTFNDTGHLSTHAF